MQASPRERSLTSQSIPRFKGGRWIDSAALQVDSAFVSPGRYEDVWRLYSRLGPRHQGRAGWPLPNKIIKLIGPQHRPVSTLKELDFISAAKPGMEFLDWWSPAESPATIRVSVAHQEADTGVLVYTGTRPSDGKWAWIFWMTRMSGGRTRIYFRAVVEKWQPPVRRGETQYGDRIFVDLLPRGDRDFFARNIAGV